MKDVNAYLLAFAAFLVGLITGVLYMCPKFSENPPAISAPVKPARPTGSLGSLGDLPKSPLCNCINCTCDPCKCGSKFEPMPKGK